MGRITSEENKAIARRCIEGLNQENLVVFDEILAPEFPNHSPSLGTMSREATVHDFALIFKALPTGTALSRILLLKGTKCSSALPRKVLART